LESWNDPYVISYGWEWLALMMGSFVDTKREFRDCVYGRRWWCLIIWMVYRGTMEALLKVVLLLLRRI
jgi:hypothetical protein